MFSRTLRLGKTDSPARSAQTRLTPAAIASPADAVASGAPSSTTLPPVIGHQPEDRAADQLLAGAAQADQPDHLAGMQRAVHRPHRPDRHPLEAQPRFAFPPGGPAEYLRRLAPHDQQDGLLGHRLADAPLARDLAVAQDDHPVGDLEHLVEAMRDVDHADAPGAKVPERREQAHHLVRRQAGGRLVEDEDLGLLRQRAGDGDQRLLGPAEALDADVRIDVGAEDVERPRRAPARRRPVHHPEPPRISQRQADVLGDGHPVDQAEVLMDEGDRQPPQRLGHVPAAIADGAFVQRIDAREDLDQGGLSGAVLAEERDDLAGADVHADVVERLRAAEELGDVPHLEQRIAGHLRGRATGPARLNGLPRDIHPPSSPWHRLTRSTQAPRSAVRLRLSVLGDAAGDTDGFARSQVSSGMPATMSPTQVSVGYSGDLSIRILPPARPVPPRSAATVSCGVPRRLRRAGGS